MYESARKDIEARIKTEIDSQSTYTPSNPMEPNEQSLLDLSSGGKTDEANDAEKTHGESHASNGSQTVSNDGAVQSESSPLQSNIAVSTDLLQLHYEDLMDIMATARELNENSNRGLVKVHLDSLSSIWTELRKLVY